MNTEPLDPQQLINIVEAQIISSIALMNQIELPSYPVCGRVGCNDKWFVIEYLGRAKSELNVLKKELEEHAARREKP